MGELSLSPVGLSYVNKLSPKIFRDYVWNMVFCLCNGHKLAGLLSSHMEKIALESSMADFFTILVYIPITEELYYF